VYSLPNKHVMNVIIGGDKALVGIAHNDITVIAMAVALTSWTCSWLPLELLPLDAVLNWAT